MSDLHWQYLETLDNDMDTISRYVDFTSDNFETYSIEFVRLILAFCSEIDVVAKILCEKISPSSKATSINQYRLIITKKYPKFHTLEIEIPKHNIQLKPWAEWGEDNKNPSWWSSYNKVKHNRDRAYKQANLINTLNALSALFALLFYLDKKVPEMKLMTINDKHDGGCGFERWHAWRTPDEME